MAFKRPLHRWLGDPVAVLTLVAAFLLASCSNSDRLPPEARDRLIDAMGRLPGSAAPAEIVRAWPGEIRSPSEAGEIWCVEVDQTLIAAAGQDSIRTIWIVVRQDPGKEWEAAMLPTLSAWWPYEACGVTP